MRRRRPITDVRGAVVSVIGDIARHGPLRERALKAHGSPAVASNLLRRVAVWRQLCAALTVDAGAPDADGIAAGAVGGRIAALVLAASSSTTGGCAASTFADVMPAGAGG
jgi:hypothetical protein